MQMDTTTSYGMDPDLTGVPGCGCMFCCGSGGGALVGDDQVGGVSIPTNPFVAGQTATAKWATVDDQGRIDLSYAFASTTSHAFYASNNADVIFDDNVWGNESFYIPFDQAPGASVLGDNAIDLKADVLTAFDTLSRVAKMTFSESSFESSATDLKILAMGELAVDGALLNGRATFPGVDMTGDGAEPYEAYILYDALRAAMTTDPEQGGATNRLHVAIHELMHSLGVFHPQWSLFGRNWTEPGVDDPDDNVLDNARYTVMSAERGGLDVNLQSLDHGAAATPMVIDIAVLRHLYGSTEAHTGDTVYRLTDPETADLDVDGDDDGTVSIGRAFYAITDTGGQDTIQYSGNRHALLNLNVATLDQSGDSQAILDIIAALQASALFDTLLPSATAGELRNDLLEAAWHAGGFGSRIFDGTGAADLGGYYIAADAFADPAHVTRIENAIGGAQSDILVGNQIDNRLEGNGGVDLIVASEGNDTLDGGGGADSLVGGQGNDFYIVDDAGDAVVEAVGGGIDTIQSAISLDLRGISTEVESLWMMGSAPLTVIGNFRANLILGNDGHSTLNGAWGNDTMYGGIGNDVFQDAHGGDSMIGGLGNDLYMVDSVFDRVVEQPGQGTDTIVSAGSLDLRVYSNEVEVLVLTGVQTAFGTGNALDNRIEGNGGANTLDGGAGQDTLLGGAGFDTYVVDDALDVVVEEEGAGYDMVHAHISYTLSAHVEALTLLGTEDLTGTGTGAANRIYGNDGANILNGAGGDDTLLGGAGDDRFQDDAGADLMVGGLGNDVFVVDNAGDRIIERAGEGIDRVEANVSFALRDQSQAIESLTLLGAEALSGVGNGLDNVLTGNGGDNFLNGALGNDTLLGGAGNDTFEDDHGVDWMEGGAGDDVYFVDHPGDVIVEAPGEGIDTVWTSVPLLLFQKTQEVELVVSTTGGLVMGNGQNNRMTGGVESNNLHGANGADTLDGGAGQNTLAGGFGADRFDLTTVPGGEGEADLIEDFVPGTDGLALGQALVPQVAVGGLDPSLFHLGPEATAPEHRVIYDPATGRLSVDGDGAGSLEAQKLVAVLTNQAMLSAADIEII